MHGHLKPSKAGILSEALDHLCYIGVLINEGAFMRAAISITIIAIAICALVLTTSAYATQVIHKNVEYTNDSIEQGGKLQACIITAAIITPPAPEVVNFQFMEFVNGRVAFKVTAGDINWTNASSVAKRISEADFFTGAFNQPNAFDKKITTEGQLVAFLKEPGLILDFSAAFFGGNYSIRFRRTDTNDERIYEIEQPVPASVLASQNVH
jgi:hypothetical protein